MTSPLRRDPLEEFSKRYGKNRAATILSVLGKGQAFLQALATSVGQEIMADLEKEWEFLLVKVVEKQNTEEERIKFLVIDGLLKSWAKKIAKHYAFESQYLPNPE